MNVLFFILATPFVVYMCFIRPFQTENIKRGTVKHPNPKFRVTFYKRSIVYKLGSVAFIVAAMVLSGQSLEKLVSVKPSLPLVPADFWTTVLIITLELLILTEILNHVAKLRHFLVVGDVAVILPRTTKERLWWVPTAIAAGIGEELMYRSFLLFYVMSLPFHLPMTVSLVIIAALFGFSHLYQGWFGVLATSVAGFLLGSIYVQYGILLVIVIHCLIDLRAALMLPDRLRRRKVST